MTEKPLNYPTLEVFYDSQCSVCDREIRFIMGKLDKRHSVGAIRFTDICIAKSDDSSLSWDRQILVGTNRSREQLMREIHARFVTDQNSSGKDDEWMVGPEVFRQIYSRLGVTFPVWLSRLPVIRNVVQGAYRVFAYFRFRAAMKRMRKITDCGTEGCSVPSRAN